MEEREILDKTLVLRIAYNGFGFCGFAEQPQQRTVAGELRRAIETFLRREISLTCAGRTDSGVHAISQFVSVPITFEETNISKKRIEHAMNALLPDEIAVNGIFLAQQGFSARFDAVARKYVYRIVTGPSRPVFLHEYAWYIPNKLDEASMQQAATILIGEHDFKSFCKASSAVGKPTHRYVSDISFSHSSHLGEETLEITVCGNAFLHSMVRTIVGTLVEIGQGRRSVAWMEQVLLAANRTAAGPCAPACGLTFKDVMYQDDALHPWKVC